LTRQKKRPETVVAQQIVSSAIENFYGSKDTPHGLPEDVLLHALEGYTKDLTWPLIREKALDFEKYASKHVSDCTIRRVLRRPIGQKPPAASVCIFRLAARPLRSTQTLFGAYTYTFTFWPSGLWFLSTTDPLSTTDHLHQRLVERASRNYESLAKTQDHLSVLWPTLLELGQQRQRRGLPGNVTHFVTPLADGLIFGEIQKMDMTTEIADAAAPRLMDCKAGVVIQRQLVDYFRNAEWRVQILVKTFIGRDELKDGQHRLKAMLDRYIRRHTTVVESFRNQTRLAFDSEPPYGPALRDLYMVPRPTSDDFKRAIAELDALTLSDEWSNEISRSVENQSRRKLKT
jgi:hypothetical protein